MTKSPDAFRTISEVADWLGVQAHVLRFWESKFTQIKPVKRAGGRRYYRPADMQLLSGIKTLLHDQGVTIKGVQKLLRERGIAGIAALSQPLEDGIEAEPIEYESATVLPFAFGKTADTAEPAVDATPEAPAYGPDTSPAEPDLIVPETPAMDSPAPDAPPPEQTAQIAEPETPASVEPAVARAPRARDIETVDPPRESDIPYHPGPLARLARIDRLSARQARDMAPLAQELRAWANRVSQARTG